MRVFCTGISGSNRTAYLEKVKGYAEEKGEKIKIYDIGPLMFEYAKKLGKELNKENILNVSMADRQLFVGATFESAVSDFQNHQNIIISSHAEFYWKKVFTRANNWMYLDKTKPDMFVTIINDPGSVKKKLCDEKHAEQWKDQRLSLDEILLWENIEVNETEGWAEREGDKHYVISSNEPPSLLYKLMFEPKTELVYASFPMSHLHNEENKKKSDEFVSRLRNYFAVLNPKSIETIEDGGEKFTETQESHIVHRDLYWFVGKADKVIVYIPELVFSAGVISEFSKGSEMGKDVWLIVPKGKIPHLGPFEKHYKKKIFDDERKFFRFVEGYVKEKRKKEVSS